ERLLDLWLQVADQPRPAECQVYVIHQGDQGQRAAALLAEDLRDAGLRVIVHAGSSGFRSQFRRADASGAQVAVILGENELADGNVSVKWLRRRDVANDEQQQTMPLESLARQLKEKV